MKKKSKNKTWNVDGYIFGALRKIWRWHPVRKDALNRAELIDSFGEKKEKCAHCFTLFGKKEVQVDHIDPVVKPEAGFVDWNTYIKRLLYITAEQTQVLCKPCHKLKSAKENSKRRRKK